MVDLSAEREMARPLLSDRMGLLFVAALPFWMYLPNYLSQLPPDAGAMHGLIILLFAAGCTFGTMLSTYRLDRDTMTWATSRVGMAGLLVVSLAVIFYQLTSEGTGADLVTEGPALLQTIGFAGAGLLYAAIAAAVAFLVFYYRHGPTGRESIEDEILEDE